MIYCRNHISNSNEGGTFRLIDFKCLTNKCSFFIKNYMYIFFLLPTLNKKSLREILTSHSTPYKIIGPIKNI